MAGTPAFVRLQPDSTGKKIQTFEIMQGSDTVEIQGVVLVDSSGNPITTLPVSLPAGTATSPNASVITVQRPAVTQVVSTAFEASHVLKASAGQLVQLSIFNSKASAQFVLLINATSLPANGAVTLLYPPIPIAAATLLVLDLPAPLVASTGIVVCNSSTGSFTKTLGAADCAFYAQVN